VGGFCDLRGEEVVQERENRLGMRGTGRPRRRGRMGQEQKNGGSAGPSRLSGSQLKWRLNQMRLGSARIGAGSSSGSSRRLAGAAATLACNTSLDQSGVFKTGSLAQMRFRCQKASSHAVDQSHWQFLHVRSFNGHAMLEKSGIKAR